MSFLEKMFGASPEEKAPTLGYKVLEQLPALSVDLVPASDDLPHISVIGYNAWKED